MKINNKKKIRARHDLLVMLATYNEKNNITRMVNSISSLPIDCDILVVDDNSPDGTGKLVADHNDKRLFLISRTQKLGLGSAYCLGFQYAIDKKYDKIIQIDADISHNPLDIKELLKDSMNYDLTIGSRYIGGIRIINWPISRLFLSYFANLYSRKIIGFNIF